MQALRGVAMHFKQSKGVAEADGTWDWWPTKSLFYTNMSENEGLQSRVSTYCQNPTFSRPRL